MPWQAYLGEPAVLSVGTLFQAAFLPGIMLAVLYAAYAFGYALLRPENAPPIDDEGGQRSDNGSMQRKLFWLLGVPAIAVLAVAGSNTLNLAGWPSVTCTSEIEICGGGSSLSIMVATPKLSMMLAFVGLLSTM